MKTAGKFTKIAVAAAVTTAVALPASTAFAGEKTERAIIGAVLGGVAGAAVSKGGGGATAVGAVAGAAIGAATAKKKDHRYRSAYRTSRPAYYRDSAYYNRDAYAYRNGYTYRDGAYRPSGRYYDTRYGYYR